MDKATLDAWQLVANIAIIIAPFIVAGGLVFAWSQCEAMKKARMAELVLSLFDQWSSPQMAKSRHAICINSLNLETVFDDVNKSNDEKLFYDYTMLPNFLDTVGVLICEGYLDRKIAFDMFGKSVQYYYGLFESIIKDPAFKGNLSYFTKLHDLFLQEEADRSKVKKRSA